jgi:hypothetical protein
MEDTVGVGAGAAPITVGAGAEAIIHLTMVILQGSLPHHLCMFNARIWRRLRRNLLIIGITAEIRKVIILMSRNAPRAGCRWRLNPQLNNRTI